MWLDHLRLVSPSRRREWCPLPGQRVAGGAIHEVCLQQGKHKIRLRFKTEVLTPNERIEDVFTTWPLQGARRLLMFTSDPGDAQVTLLTEIDEWKPPFLVKRLVDKRIDQQVDQFEEKLNNAKRIIETVYLAHGEDAFDQGVLSAAESVGLIV